MVWRRARLVCAVATAWATFTHAQGSTICNNYSQSLFPGQSTGQEAFVHLFVAIALLGNAQLSLLNTNSTNVTIPGTSVPVPGILTSAGGTTYNGTSVNITPYFSGALNSTNLNGVPSAVNFLDGGAVSLQPPNIIEAGFQGSKQATLFDHLCSYFASLLGCSAYGSSSGGIPSYTGGQSMYSVHKYMNITAAEFGFFVHQLGLSLRALGVADSQVKTFNNTVISSFGQRCSSAKSIIPGQSSQLQAICTDGSCTKASDPDCAAYAAAASSAPASSSARASSTQAISSSTSTSATTAATTSATSSPDAASTSHSDSGLSDGAKIGIGIGVGLGVLAIAVIIGFWLIARRRSKTARFSKDIRLVSISDRDDLASVDLADEKLTPIELDSRARPVEMQGSRPQQIYEMQ